EQLRSYHERFGREHVLTVIYEDFRADNAATVRDVLRFLEVDEGFEIERQEANPTVRVRSRRLEQALQRASAGRGPLARAVKALTPRRLRRGAMQAARRAAVDTNPAPADARLMAELRARYEGEVLAAGELLGRDLAALWGYGRPA